MLAFTLQRGDLVILQGPQGDKQLLKRIVALVGDRVRIKEGLLFVNGSPVDEPYAHHDIARMRELDDWPTGANAQEVTVPNNMAFVLGDNRSASIDSRLWGPVALSDVTAKVIAKLP
jgi:signal peptidase I